MLSSSTTPMALQNNRIMQIFFAFFQQAVKILILNEAVSAVVNRFRVSGFFISGNAEATRLKQWDSKN